MTAARRPALIVVADSLWKEAYPGPLHVLVAEIARDHPVIWVEAPLWRAIKAPGLGPRLRRALRLDLPLVRYVDGQRELDILTPPLAPVGNALGDALLAQTVRWILKGRKLEPRVLWNARRDPAASGLVKRLAPGVIVDFHLDPEPETPWLPEADLVFWPEGLPAPAGGTEVTERLMRTAPGIRGALKLAPMVRGWLTGQRLTSAPSPEVRNRLSSPG